MKVCKAKQSSRIDIWSTTYEEPVESQAAKMNVKKAKYCQATSKKLPFQKLHPRTEVNGQAEDNISEHNVD